MSLTGGSSGDRLLAAGLAGGALVGSLAHLGRPAMAWKALRNLRRSWLSREVALFGIYAALTALAVAVPAVAPAAAGVGAAGLYASARLYIVPGRPSWDTPLTLVAFAATGGAVGPTLTGHAHVAAVAGVVALAAPAANLARLHGRADLSERGTVELNLHRLPGWTLARVGLGAGGVAAALAGTPVAAVAVLLLTAELIGRWLFYVTVVPRNMPGSFWRGAAGSDR